MGCPAGAVKNGGPVTKRGPPAWASWERHRSSVKARSLEARIGGSGRSDEQRKYRGEGRGLRGGNGHRLDRTADGGDAGLYEWWFAPTAALGSGLNPLEGGCECIGSRSSVDGVWRGRCAGREDGDCAVR